MTYKKWTFIACVGIVLSAIIGLIISNQSKNEVALHITPSATSEFVQASSQVNTKASLDTYTEKVNKLSQRVSEYHIDVKVNTEDHILEGEQIVTWINPGKVSVEEMYLHLYANAFKSLDTTFMKESSASLRGDKADLSNLGSIEITKLETLEGDNLLPRVSHVSPDDYNPNDSTVATFRLIDPIKPGKQATFKISFKVKLPKVFARMGYSDEFILGGQWFPKIAAYETDKTGKPGVNRWNVHQYHGNSEFYSNFSVYSVNINIPDTYTVAATGMQTKNTPHENGRKTVTYYADDVHDFAFAASPNFIVHEASFSDENIPGVKIKLYIDPAHESLVDRYVHAAKSSLSYLGKHYGTYPYSVLSIVVPPASASGAGGMEYPTFITANAATTDNPQYELERTVVHEIAHQYWYGIVATNEFEEAWLDEGFTSFSEEKIMENAYGVNYNSQVESSYVTARQPLNLAAWKFNSKDIYAENVYLRGKLILLDIESIIGETAMNRVLRQYYQKYKFKSPTSTDFQHVLEAITKNNWQNYFDKFVYGNENSDLRVIDIREQNISEGDQALYEYTIMLEHNSGIERTIPLLMKYEGQQAKIKHWVLDQSGKAHFIERSSQPLEWVQVDPNHANKLDHTVTNNFLFASDKKEQASKRTSSATFILDLLLSSFSW